LELLAPARSRLPRCRRIFPPGFELWSPRQGPRAYPL
jgi:hypothetical protein